MYTESSNNFPSSELMHYNSSTENANTVNSDYINNLNNLDFDIYSQPTLTDYFEDELFNPLPQIGRQALVNQQETQIDVTNYSESSPLNNHTAVENFHYTTPNQSDFTAASPHGYSENISTPLLEPYTNNGTYSVQSTPLLVSEPLFSDQLIFSPIINNSPAAFSDLQLFEDIVSTPYTAPVLSCTPLITPNTPYINTPYVTNNSPYSVASSTINTPFAFRALDTPIETNADPHLYDENSHNWFNLFGPPSANTLSTDTLKSVVKRSPVVYEDNIYCHNVIPFDYLNMDTISPANVSIEKKLDTSEMIHESPKSHQSEASPSERTASLATSPTSAVENIAAISKTVPESVEPSKLTENNSGIIETIKTEAITNILSHTPDSAPTTPQETPKLVAIRPRPHDDEDSGENESTRRSKRQRTMSVSEENEEENDDEAEKKYNCPECGRGFNRKFNMQTHRSTHDPNRIKPFACEHPNCGSRFTRKHDLKRHINGIHKGEKVHECTVCRKPFSRKDAWKRHIATCGKV